MKTQAYTNAPRLMMSCHFVSLLHDTIALESKNGAQTLKSQKQVVYIGMSLCAHICHYFFYMLAYKSKVYCLCQYLFF